jgi:hypothetical protein
MKALGLVPSDPKLGWVMHISDDDNTTHLPEDDWAGKAVMLIPNDPTFVYWDDARTCGELVFELGD